MGRGESRVFLQLPADKSQAYQHRNYLKATLLLTTRNYRRIKKYFCQFRAAITQLINMKEEHMMASLNPRPFKEIYSLFDVTKAKYEKFQKLAFIDIFI